MSKIKSSTLIEVIIALVIVSVFMALFYSYVQKSQKEHNLKIKILANIAINNEIARISSNNAPADTAIAYNQIVVKTSVKDTINELFFITFDAVDKRDKVLISRTIWYLKK